jgi:hypothetical protein
VSGGRLRPAGGAALLVALGLAVSACGNAGPESREGRTNADARFAASLRTQRFPELLNVRPQRSARDAYDFMVLMGSPYDSPRRYADGWRVLSLRGQTLGEKRLARPHSGEQPFWRRQSGVRVPVGTRQVQLEGHDSRNGYGGRRLTVTLP